MYPGRFDARFVQSSHDVERLITFAPYSPDQRVNRTNQQENTVKAKRILGAVVALAIGLVALHFADPHAMAAMRLDV